VCRKRGRVLLQVLLEGRKGELSNEMRESRRVQEISRAHKRGPEVGREFAENSGGTSLKKK
jgi:hypothetical protein